MEVAVRRDDVIREPTVDLTADDAAVRTEIRSARQAVEASSTVEHRVDEDPIAGADPCLVGAADHLAGHLVTHDDGVRRRHGPREDLQVGSADAAVRHPDEHLIGARLRPSHVGQGQIEWLSEDDRPHATPDSGSARRILRTIIRPMFKLGIVIASVREGRVGLPVAEWCVDRARRHARFDVALIDLKEVDLPVFAERTHPRLQQYEGDKHKAWSAVVAGIDAFVFVTPEYNHGTAPALVNALDYLYVEWHYKAAAFVSYGGMSGGIRAVQMTKQSLATLKIVPIAEAVAIPFVSQAIDRESGAFKASEQHDKTAATMFDELHRWTTALASLRP